MRTGFQLKGQEGGQKKRKCTNIKLEEKLDGFYSSANESSSRNAPREPPRLMFTPVVDIE